jgi:hypothetical protein
LATKKNPLTKDLGYLFLVTKKSSYKQSSLFIIAGEKSPARKCLVYLSLAKKSIDKQSSLFIVDNEKSPVRNSLSYLTMVMKQSAVTENLAHLLLMMKSPVTNVLAYS